MHRFTYRIAGIATAAIAAPLLLSAGANAEPDTVFFSTGSFSCAISGDGSVGCDLTYPHKLSYEGSDSLSTTSDIVIDGAEAPAHPTGGPGGSFTRPDGNPPLADVKTGSGQWGSVIEHAGAKCEEGFHGSFSCTAMGHTFSSYDGVISA